MDLKLFSTQIETWGSPLLIRAFDKKDAEGLTRALFKVPTDVGVTATSEEGEIIGRQTARREESVEVISDTVS